MKTNFDADSALLSAIADPNRLRIVRELAQVGAQCACDLGECCTVSQPTMSHHLRVLREAGWVTSERRGTWVWFTVRPEALERFRRIGESLGQPITPPPGLPRLRVLQPGA